LPADDHPQHALTSERWALLHTVTELTERPMIALSFLWLVLMVLDFTVGLTPVLVLTTNVIWALFGVDFLLRLLIAPEKGEYLRQNWLTALALVLPAVRLLRAFRALRALRAARAVRSVSLLRVVTSLNRGMRALGRTLGRRGIGYVMILTVLVMFAGAAGMLHFESPQSLREAGLPVGGTGLRHYGEALWWTAMLMTSLGSEYWPRTGEGRILCWLLSLYALAVFGYITATIASHLIGLDTGIARAEDDTKSPADMRALHAEIAALRAEVATLSARIDPRGASAGDGVPPASASERPR
jgi:voltage-gated potassium channel